MAFAALRVPIYALLLALLFGGGGASSAVIVGMDAFFIIHVALHVVFRDHPENRFGSAFSWSLIAGAGACGSVDLVLLVKTLLSGAGRTLPSAPAIGRTSMR